MYAYLTDVNDVSERDANTMLIAYTGQRGPSDPDAPIRIVRISSGSEGCKHEVLDQQLIKSKN